uniref:K-box domain-containing protein n=1 Tax=Caenorhabditis tropicalis TaxID=1561998 RepID=A0A1I7TWR2_9PELO
MKEQMSVEAFLASGSLEEEDRKKKGIQIISIQDLYKDLDRRLFLLGARSPFPNGYMRVSMRELKTATARDLERIKAHYKDLQQKIMDIQMEHWKICFVWYLDTSKAEWRIREFGRMILGTDRRRN